MNQTTPADERYGTLVKLEDGRWQLRFVRTLEHPLETVWRAVTEPDHLAHWFPTTIIGERAAGAPLRFTFPRGQAEPFAGEMLTYEPPRVIELRWGPDVVRIELQAASEGTRLTLLDTLQERGKGARDGAGWHVCLDALERELDGGSAPHEEIGAWRDLHPRYQESFGPEASRIGPPAGMG